MLPPLAAADAPETSVKSGAPCTDFIAAMCVYVLEVTQHVFAAS